MLTHDECQPPCFLFGRVHFSSNRSLFWRIHLTQAKTFIWCWSPFPFKLASPNIALKGWIRSHSSKIVLIISFKNHLSNPVFRPVQKVAFRVMIVFWIPILVLLEGKIQVRDLCFSHLHTQITKWSSHPLFISKLISTTPQGAWIKGIFPPAKKANQTKDMWGTSNADGWLYYWNAWRLELMYHEQSLHHGYLWLLNLPSTEIARPSFWDTSDVTPYLNLAMSYGYAGGGIHIYKCKYYTYEYLYIYISIYVCVISMQMYILNSECQKDSSGRKQLGGARAQLLFPSPRHKLSLKVASHEQILGSSPWDETLADQKHVIMAPLMFENDGTCSENDTHTVCQEILK